MPEIVMPTLFNNPRLKQETPPPVLIASDDFARADIAYPPAVGSMGVTSFGDKTWTRQSNGSQTNFGGRIVGGKAGVVGNVTSTGARTFMVADFGLADGSYSLRYVSGLKDNTIAMVARYVDSGNFIFVTTVGTKWALYKRVAFAGVQVYTAAGLPDIADGDVLKLVLNGSSVTLVVNGVATPTQTIADFTTATKYGFGATMPVADTQTPLVYWDDPTFTIPGSWS